MERPRLKTFLISIMVITISFGLADLMYMYSKGTFKGSHPLKKHLNVVKTPESTTTTKEELMEPIQINEDNDKGLAKQDQVHFDDRISKKKQACDLLRNIEINNTKLANVQFEPWIFYVPNYNLSYCTVGKAGGTFIKHMFSVLIKGINESRKLEASDRHLVHQRIKPYKVPYATNEWRHSRMMTVVRNPYSRIFSAYIDRVFVPSIEQEIRKGASCRFDITFDEYLKIILNHTEKGWMNHHWSPIYYICKSCDVKSTFIVKQETFTSDITFVIDKLEISADRQVEIVRKLTDSRIDWTLTGMVIGKMGVSKRLAFKAGCIGWFGAVKRIWKSFQITGYIAENVELPITLYNTTDDFSNTDLFLKIIFDTIEKYPMSSETMAAQRHRALVNAYRDVDEKIIEDIKRIYRPDFEMFGYSFEPPT